MKLIKDLKPGDLVLLYVDRKEGGSSMGAGVVGKPENAKWMTFVGHVYTENVGSVLNILQLKPNAAPAVYTLAPDLSINYIWASGNAQWIAMGDYRVFIYNDNVNNATQYVVWDTVKSSILDSLAVNYGQWNYRIRYNSLYIRDWNSVKSYYFNVNSGKFEQILPFHSQRAFTYRTYESSVNDGIIMMVKPNYYGTPNVIQARFLINGVLSADVTMPYFGNGWNWELGANGFTWAYEKVVNGNLVWIINLYDFSFNLLNTYNSGMPNMYFSVYIGERPWSIFGDGTNDKYVMMSPIGVELLELPSSVSTNFWIDDAIYND